MRAGIAGWRAFSLENPLARLMQKQGALFEEALCLLSKTHPKKR